jgi:nicotinate-nucleotide pyrophosphorylase
MDADLEAQIERALAEDVGDGDATTTPRRRSTL